MGGASKACLSRLQKEYQRLGKEPVPNVVAEPK
jgi:ubiquitin-protein ligase